MAEVCCADIQVVVTELTMNDSAGQLPMFLGWIIVLFLQQCVALSLAELISRYPVSGGPYFWAFQLTNPKRRETVAFFTGWTWLIGNWTITLSVNFGFASLVSAAISLYHPEWVATPWKMLLIFYGICLATFFACSFGNRFLPLVDTVCAVFTIASILITLICLSVKAKADRHSISDTLVWCPHLFARLQDTDGLGRATMTRL